ncbi:hypothetical protein PCANC_04290 [Puccinia coronata f. sp. avenae]|uniref:Glycoside hydrolase family 2 immunoglobulin-like beta-sandwich domain-containing protein n=1 Tax=Puccinia coronata f. sp. avenae TaxID=200324 RepID=A0A2N5TLJ0_9BASI|nr:hypothetical protein PCASD_20713 [Puccinia coronata f. sp. avenae]PLW53659.1 hypothetical protein PCANC_04290 [Puccinia coronata f. sp. avenae]
MFSLSILIHSLIPSFLVVRFVAAASNCPAPTPYALKTPPLTTDWTAKVGSSPWPEYPRPLLRRRDWLNLNGPWQFKPANNSQEIKNPPFGGCGLSREILVPFPMESGLSGIMENHMYSWYRRTFVVPQGWSGHNVLLNFGAVDYEATVFVNGKNVGFHRGGYFKFTLDITDALKQAGQENELLVFVYDPTNSEGTLIPVGKQVLKPDHIFYTPSSGIWQTVFLEPVPKEYILDIQTTAHADGSVKIQVSTSNTASKSPLKIIVLGPTLSSSDSALYPRSLGAPLQQLQGTANTPISFTLPSPQLWSPQKPNLYHFQVELGQDAIQSYLGFRTIEKKKDSQGIVRPFLNGEFVFQLGTLDQGFWPDGLYTAPTLQAMEYDLRVLKQLGFNMVRKHIKIEPDLFYYACDRMGLLVWQDMPSLNPHLPWPTPEQQTEFVRQLKLMITTHLSFPSIVTWVLYNEGWGQLRSSEIELTPMVKELDPSRPVLSVSGWRDSGAGDFHDSHHYPYPQCGTPFYSLPSTPYDPSRIGVQGEFGGIGHIPSRKNLWNVQSALDTLNQTYEITSTIEIWNYRALSMVGDLRDQAQSFSCSGGVFTQTTDVEAETNGLLTYDRRILRPNLQKWQALISAIYSAARSRSNGGKSSTHLFMRIDTGHTALE